MRFEAVMKFSNILERSAARRLMHFVSTEFCNSWTLRAFNPPAPFLRQAAVVTVHCSSVTHTHTRTGPPVVQLPQLYSKFILVWNYEVDFKILPIILFFLWQPWRGFFLQKLYFDINLQNVMETRGILDTSMKYWWRC